MRALIQRVSRGAVRVDSQTIAEIGSGFVILLGVTHGDDAAAVAYLTKKIAHLRVFEDDQGKMNRSLLDTGGEALVVSQFTLYADTRRGRRPAFVDAAPPQVARPLVDSFVQALRDLGVPTQCGVFGAHMQVDLVNDGPVTILLEK